MHIKRKQFKKSKKKRYQRIFFINQKVLGSKGHKFKIIHLKFKTEKTIYHLQWLLYDQ